jgi:hypothetical protein
MSVKLLTEELKSAIVSLTKDGLDQEIGGLLILEEDLPVLVPCQNIAHQFGLDKTDWFILDPEEEERAKEVGTVAAFYHVHYKESHYGEFSYPDINNSQKAHLPYILYHAEYKTWDYYEPDGLHPFPLKQPSYTPDQIEFYLRWRWVWARSDCYTLLRSYYKGMLGIDLPQIERSEDEKEYRQEGWDRYREGLLANDFVALDRDSPIQLHDVILMRADGENYHHVGIITDPDKQYMVHHLCYPRLSERIIWGGDWYQDTHPQGIYRHRSLIDGAS